MSMRLPGNGGSSPIQPENQSFISKMKQKAESKIGRNFKADLSEKLQSLANNVKNSKVGELFSSSQSPLRLAFTNVKAIAKASFILPKEKLQAKIETTRRNSLSNTTKANPELDKNFSHLEGLVNQKIRQGKFAEAKLAILEVQLENDDPELEKKLEGLLNKVQGASGEQTSPEPVDSFPVFASIEQEPTLLFESIHKDGEEPKQTQSEGSNTEYKPVSLERRDETILKAYENAPLDELTRDHIDASKRGDSVKTTVLIGLITTAKQQIKDEYKDSSLEDLETAYNDALKSNEPRKADILYDLMQDKVLDASDISDMDSILEGLPEKSGSSITKDSPVPNRTSQSDQYISLKDLEPPTRDRTESNPKP